MPFLPPSDPYDTYTTPSTSCGTAKKNIVVITIIVHVHTRIAVSLSSQE